MRDPNHLAFTQHALTGDVAGQAPAGEKETLFNEYPSQGIEQWHRSHGLYLE